MRGQVEASAADFAKSIDSAIHAGLPAMEAVQIVQRVLMALATASPGAPAVAAPVAENAYTDPDAGESKTDEPTTPA